MVASRLDVKPIDTQSSFRTQAYHALKQAITSVNIYAQPHEIRLDERQLSQDLGVSRTPIREAMTLLEQEGFVKTLRPSSLLERFATVEEVANMVVYAASKEASATNGAALRAEGGIVQTIA